MVARSDPGFGTLWLRLNVQNRLLLLDRHGADAFSIACLLRAVGTGLLVGADSDHLVAKTAGSLLGLVVTCSTVRIL